MSDIEFDDWMNESDALLWHLERDPLLRSTITTVWILDRAPDDERFARSIQRAVETIPRLRQRAVSDARAIAPPRWDLDPHFDIDYHVRRGRVVGRGTTRDLLDQAAPIAQQAFDKERPLWELHLLDGMIESRSAIVLKLHHTIGDGVGLVQMVGAIVDLERDPDPIVAPDSRIAPPGPATSIERAALAHQTKVTFRRGLRGAGALGRGWVDYVRHPVDTSKAALTTTASIARALRPVARPMSPVMTGRSLSTRFDALQTTVATLKASAATVDGTVNDAFVAAVLGGLGRYHRHHDAMVDELRMTMPISIRPTGSGGRTAGNQFAPARFSVPLGIADPVERMREIHERVERERAEPAYARMNQVSTGLFSLRPAVFTRIGGSALKAIDLVTSNVPGPPVQVYIAGARVERAVPFGPLSGAAANITLLSYDGTGDVGINMDRAAVPDADVFARCLDEGLAEIAAVGES